MCLLELSTVSPEIILATWTIPEITEDDSHMAQRPRSRRNSVTRQRADKSVTLTLTLTGELTALPNQ